MVSALTTPPQCQPLPLSRIFDCALQYDCGNGEVSQLVNYLIRIVLNTLSAVSHVCKEGNPEDCENLLSQAHGKFRYK